MTNKDIAIALGYRVQRLKENGRWHLFAPNNPISIRSTKASHTCEQAEENFLNKKDFRTDLLAAFEIDDWLHGKGFCTALMYSVELKSFRFKIIEADYHEGAVVDLFTGDGPTRSEAIVAAFEKYKEQDIPAYREGQTK